MTPTFLYGFAQSDNDLVLNLMTLEASSFAVEPEGTGVNPLYAAKPALDEDEVEDEDEEDEDEDDDLEDDDLEDDEDEDLDDEDEDEDLEDDEADDDDDEDDEELEDDDDPKPLKVKQRP